MKYYYIVYAHSNGFGGATFQCTPTLDLKKIRQYIIDNNGVGTNIVITGFFELTKAQYERGI